MKTDNNTTSLFGEKKKPKNPYLCDYQYITTEDGLVPALFDSLLKLPKGSPLGVDMETHGTMPQFEGHYPRLLQIAPSESFCYIFDLQLISEDIGGNIQDALRWFQPVFDGRFRLIFQNGKFDIKFIIHYGVKVNPPIFDTFLADKNLTQGRKADCDLASIFNRRISKEISLDKGEQKSDWRVKNLSQSQLKYAAIDACCLHPIREAQAKKAIADGLVRKDMGCTFSLDFGVVIPIACMELAGIRMDWKGLGQAQSKLKEEKNRLWDEFLSRIDDELKSQGKPGLYRDLFGGFSEDPNSPKKSKALLHSIGIEVENLDKDYLMGYHAENPIIQAYLLAKNKQIEWQDSHKYEPHPTTNRAFGQLKILGTETGRFSSKGYSFKMDGRNYKVGQNIQNPPRAKWFRQLFIPKPGYVFVQCDYSQIQLRIAASIAPDRVMREAYQDYRDVHRLTASNIVDKPQEEITKDERRLAKAINFGLIFGMGALALVGYAKVSYGVSLALVESEKFRNKFFELYYGIAGWHKRLSRQNLVETRSNNGRIRWLHDEWKQTLSNLANSPVQGTEADMLKDAARGIHWAFDWQNFDAQIVNLVHDEVLVEVREDQAEDVLPLVQTKMEASGRKYIKDVPIIAEPQIIPNWGDKS